MFKWYLLIYSASLLWSPIRNKSPAFPFKSISLGPVGQSVEIIYFLKNCASKRTFGKPSNFEVRIKISQFLIKLYGSDLYPNSFALPWRLLLFIKFFKFLNSCPLPIINTSGFRFKLINLTALRRVIWSFWSVNLPTVKILREFFL